MSEPSNNESQPNRDSTAIEMTYAGVSEMTMEADQPRLKLFGNLKRQPVSFNATVKNPLALREAFAALYAVVGSDFRYVPKDRTAYQAYRRLKNQTANLGAWQAQQAYFDWLARNDPYAFCVLDPIISVHPDKLLFEVFSKDEGAYSTLSVNHEAFDVHGKPTYGTTNIDFSDRLHHAIEQFRSYQDTRLTIGQQEVKVESSGKTPVLEKKINVPDSWIRGLLQVQSSATLPRFSFAMRPMDLYNTLRHLRFHKDQKGKRRGLRIELVPGEQPRIVLEPWNHVIECTGEPYAGRESRVIRVWGRRRLMLLKRMLPLADKIEVHLTGSGLPSFWVLRNEEMTFTLALTGFKASNWSQAVQFDLLLPRSDQQDANLKAVVKSLKKDFRATREKIGTSARLEGQDLVSSLQAGCQLGQVMYDIADDLYRLRPLTDEPLVTEKYEYRNRTQRTAHDLVLRQGAVKLIKENRIFGAGLELTGVAKVNEDRREYRPQLLITDEGFVSRADCTCSQFRQQGLKQGPCAHLIALRMAHVIREQHRKSGDSTDAISVETRTFGKRDGHHESVYQLTLDDRSLVVRWEDQGNQRRQKFSFASAKDAQTDYRQRIERLVADGFLDSTG